MLTICNSLFINTYFPCDDGTLLSSDLVCDMISQITVLISDCRFDCIFIAGDFNVNLNTNRVNAIHIKSLLSDFKMKYLMPVDASNTVCQTFGNEKRDCSSTIDFICFSEELSSFVSSYTVVDSHCNFSDHSPVHLLLCIHLTHLLGSGLLKCYSGQRASTCNADNNNAHDQPRFDHGNLSAYYDCTRILLQPISDELSRGVPCDSFLRDTNNCIESWLENLYDRTVKSLREAERQFIPRTKVNTLKFWWDAELNELKQKAMNSHKLWVQSGKPRSGEIFKTRTHDKFSYKSLIAKHKKCEKISLSSDLNDSLLTKNSSAFWKTWKTKVCNSKLNMPCIDGSFDCLTVNQKFVRYFKDSCSINSIDHDTEMRQTLATKLPLMLN